MRRDVMIKTAGEALHAWLDQEIAGPHAPQILPATPLDRSYKRIIYPWEIDFVQEGGDTRTEAYRYVTPSTSEVYTFPIKTADLSEFCVHCIFGGASSAATANMRVYATVGAGDYSAAYDHRQQMNATGLSYDSVTLDTAMTPTFLIFSSANTQPASNAERRMFVPQAIIIGIQTDVALVPVTLFVYGR
jgi:hypothetical protein